MPSWARTSACVVSAFLGGALVTRGAGLARADGDDTYRNLAVFARVLNYVENNYVEDVDPVTLVYGAIRGLLATLDPHSTFMEPEQYAAMKSEAQGEFGGIGIEVVKRPDGVVILERYEGGPAMKAGLHVGDTILGIKGRVAFEAPAAAILLDAHRELEKLVLSRWQQHTKEHLASTYGMLLHEAAYLDPVMRDLEAFLESSQQAVSGEVRVHLCQGRLTIVGARSPYSMMSAAAGTYGEANTLWTGAEARGFAAITGTQARLARLAKLQGDAALAEKAGEKSALKAVAS